ncbi:MAG: PAS domain-containing protein [Planctomycetota bacterium]
MSETTLAEACFDRLPDHVAVIDRTGQIVLVNQAWRRFGRENHLEDDDSALGLNYLNVCGAAEGHCAGEARSVERGLRELLAGADRAEQVVYPCFSPDTARWFAVKMFPIETDGDRYIAIVHQNVTQLIMSQAQAGMLG